MALSSVILWLVLSFKARTIIFEYQFWSLKDETGWSWWSMMMISLSGCGNFRCKSYIAWDQNLPSMSWCARLLGEGGSVGDLIASGAEFLQFIEISLPFSMMLGPYVITICYSILQYDTIGHFPKSLDSLSLDLRWVNGNTLLAFWCLPHPGTKWWSIQSKCQTCAAFRIAYSYSLTFLLGSFAVLQMLPPWVIASGSFWLLVPGCGAVEVQLE